MWHILTAFIPVIKNIVDLRLKTKSTIFGVICSVFAYILAGVFKLENPKEFAELVSFQVNSLQNLDFANSVSILVILGLFFLGVYWIFKKSPERQSSAERIAKINAEKEITLKKIDLEIHKEKK